jgi:drug/metabolite transporter (DMT)-like permease
MKSLKCYRYSNTDVTIKPSTIIIGYGSALLSAALFGSISTVAKPILATVNPILLSSMVYLISALVFTPIAQKSKSSKLTKKYFILILVTSIMGATIAPVMFFLGLMQTTAVDTSLLANGETVFSILFALWIFKERLRLFGYIAVALVLCGVFIVTTNLEFDKPVFILDSGNLLIIGSTVLWGFDNNICKIITKRVEVTRLVQIRSLLGGLILFLISVALGIPFNIQASQIISIVLLGVFGFAFSIYLYWESIKRIGVVKASSIVSLSAAFGLVLAALFLDESISIYQISAISIMLAGIHFMYKSESKTEVRY